MNVIRLQDINCAGCYRQCTRIVRKTKDKGKYCSKSCASKHVTKVKREIKSIRQMALYPHTRTQQQNRQKIQREITALHKIARNIQGSIGLCIVCGIGFLRPRPYVNICSNECDQAKDKRAKERRKVYAISLKGTAKHRARRSADKARRRTRIKDTQIELVDPLFILWRDKWRCHICGVSTPQRLRGSYDNRAPEVDHIVSLADGGTHTAGNLACACRQCNISKGSKSIGQAKLF